MNTSSLPQQILECPQSLKSTYQTFKDLSARDFTVHCPEMLWSCTERLIPHPTCRFTNFIDLDEATCSLSVTSEFARLDCINVNHLVSLRNSMAVDMLKKTLLRPLWWSQRFEGLGELRMVERKSRGNAGDLSSGTAAVVCHHQLYIYIYNHICFGMDDNHDR